MTERGSVIGWKLDRDVRARLLQRFPPKYPSVIADHVTLQSDARHQPLPPHVETRITGRADDGDSLEAMVVMVDGSTDRPDGSVFHITWSLDRRKGRQAKESNDLLKDRQWEEFDEPVTVEVTPARFP